MIRPWNDAPVDMLLVHGDLEDIVCHPQAYELPELVAVAWAEIRRRRALS